MSIRRILSCCLTLLPLITQGQNLVPNPSFENYNNCPPTIGGIRFGAFPTVTDWVSVSPTGLNTPDYFHACGGNSAGVPTNTFGWQPAHTGDAYGGLYLVTNAGVYPDHGEYLQVQLSQPMQAGHTYAVSCYISRANTNNWLNSGKIVLTDQLGIVFSAWRPLSTGIARIVMPTSVANTPGNYLRDTNWVQLRWLYTAVGGEEWMTVGNFDTNMHYITYRIPPPNVQSAIFMSYMYFDDFCVTDIGTNTSARDTVMCNNELIQLPGPAGEEHYVWNTGDTTPYLNVSSPGVYWVRAHTECNYRTDTIHVFGKQTFALPDLGTDTVYCDGITATLSSKNTLLNYTWSTGATTPAITVSQSGQYILTTSDECGTYSDTINISFQPPVSMPDIYDTIICQHIVHPVLGETEDSLRWYTSPGGSWSWDQPEIPTGEPGTHTLYVSRMHNGCESPIKPVSVHILNLPMAGLPRDTTLCEGIYLHLGTAADNVRFQWNTGETTCCIAAGTAGNYILQAENQCGTATDSIQITIAKCEQCIWVPSAFSPNGDGRNDVFKALSYCIIPQYSLTIINRWGQTVFHTTDITQGWDGKYQGQPAEIGTYYYFIKAEADIPGANEITLKGDIALIR
jgi:gliding motility-associated-like protein